MQLGTDWQLLYNAPDLADVVSSGGRGPADAALQPEVDQADRVVQEVQGVRSVTWMSSRCSRASTCPATA